MRLGEGVPHRVCRWCRCNQLHILGRLPPLLRPLPHSALSNPTIGRLRIPIATGRHGRAAPFLRDDHEQLGISGKRRQVMTR